MFPHISHERFSFRIDFLKSRFRNDFDCDPIKGSFSDISQNLCLHNALDKRLDAPVRKFQHSQYPSNGSHLVDLCHLWIFNARIFLGRQKQISVFFNGHLQSADRPLASNKQRQQHIGKDDNIPNRHQRKRVRNVGINIIFVYDGNQIVFVSFSHWHLWAFFNLRFAMQTDK